MSEKRSMAEDLVGDVRKEAVEEVAKFQGNEMSP